MTQILCHGCDVNLVERGLCVACTEEQMPPPRIFSILDRLERKRLYKEHYSNPPGSDWNCGE